MKFLIDGMLIKLGRYLRFLGFDTEILLFFSLSLIPKYANRLFITVSKDHYLQWPYPNKYLLRAKIFDDQLKELNQYLALNKHCQWLSRCSRCNHLLEIADWSEVSQQVPEGVAKNFEHFYRCPQCGKIYWEGGHMVRLAAKLQRLGIQVQKRKGEAND